MPYIEDSSYKAPLYYRNKHIATIFPSVFRKINWLQPYWRERINTGDDDFLNLDWVQQRSNKLLILSHGLEGHSERTYIRGMAQLFYNSGYDILAWNCRSCGGPINKAKRLYCHAHYDDLNTVVNHANGTNNYEQINFIGFSMGANLTLNYLGRQADNLPLNINKAVLFSAPTQLADSALTLDFKSNFFYRKKFIDGLWPKIILKEKQYPGIVNLEDIKHIKEWKDFDAYFSAKINGFLSADDFYNQGSPYNYLSKINIPTLIINAQDDPLLTKACAPIEIAKKSKNLYLETPRYGGHVGFQDKEYHIWSERRALEFINAKI